MVTEFEAINKAVKLSKEKYPDEIVLVFQRADGQYDYCLDANYDGEENTICGQYLNGHLAPT